MPALPVLVGVDHTPAARSAVLWAAEEAGLAGSGLLIVHSPSIPSSAISGRFAEVALRACDDVGRALLDSSIALATAQRPDVPVTALLSHSDAAQALIDLSTEASLIVLGSPGSPAGEMSLLGSKRNRIAVHAHCPVLLLGPTSSFSYPERVSRIVVGASDTYAGAAAVAFAAAEAQRRGIELHVVAATRRGATASETIAGAKDLPITHTAFGSHQRQRSAQYQGLSVVNDVITAEPAEMLPSYSDGHTILVIGCHHSDDHWSTRLGPVATSVIHRARGPVVVVGSAVAQRAAWAF